MNDTYWFLFLLGFGSANIVVLDWGGVGLWSSDLTIAPDGIGLLVDHLGRCTGDAYVQFTSAEMLARAKEKHLEKMGRR